MVMNALACGNCGAGLPPPDTSGTSCCVYCGTEHRERTSEILAAVLPSSLAAQSGSVFISERRSWRDGEDAARIPMTEEAVLHLIRQNFGDAASVFVCPHVPPKKEQAARRAHLVHLPARERVLALYDATSLGSGEEGFLVTAQRLCWKNAHEPARSMLWRNLDPDRLYVDIGRIFIGDDAIAIGEDGILDACADAFHVLALSGFPPRPLASARVVGQEKSFGATPPLTTPATPPPPHTTSYHAYASHAESQRPDCVCWHCLTPLYKATPQCAFCGAFPQTSKGWQRTA